MVSPAMLPQQDPAPRTSTLEARRHHDSNAYRRASEPARREAAALLAALLGGAPPGEIEPKARAAMDAIGLLWEAAARLNER